ncbi:hypothetical protein TWF694_009586 [Orbilia ellipsospora]|uniref:F-box domain-containing protein n=1 Tax=Orbilia ellipsospora TaxID=2528407 RepID=A0AAV9XBL4_9PEZI
MTMISRAALDEIQLAGAIPIHCAICRARTLPAEKFDEFRFMIWSKKLLFLNVDVPGRPEPHIVGQDYGKIVRPTPAELRCEPEVWNKDVRAWVRTGALLYVYGRDMEALDGRCFPIHQTCWGAFKLVGQAMQKMQSGELPPKYLRILAALVGVEDFMCDGQFSGPNLQYAAAEPTKMPQAVLNTMDLAKSTRAYKLPIWRNAMAGEVCTVPDILPLPVELTHKVLSYLPGSYILQLAQYKYPKRLGVPDLIWKEQFEIRGEVGHVRHHVEHMEGMSWYMTFIATRAMVYFDKEDWPGMKCWRRIWDMCVRLWDAIGDVERVEGGSG